MNLKGQHTGSFFTFLAGLIILAHTVVPHHHHSEITHSSKEESACETPAQGQNPEKTDSHCHAFNVLVSEKTSTTSLNQLSDHFNFFPAGIIVQSEIPPVKDITTTIFGNHAIFIKQFFYTAHSLRAPPAIA
ncbi:hypothetical protein [Mangrovibacterium marinum]|uniref:hypothetical protein n=1 Tax=Mangrovibacterium marinum TaxID=1639118 RepID=UPI000D313EDB|nr:hypothetical protein [Mangrovibacterium marinum]